ncbi:MAG: hypothetical protein HZC40_00510 [Chloroflexi bacterium]|nr:hypothetical protein [Chloroflexota bacterium]
MRHHTKDKGDIGLGFVIADLFSHGIQVALPMSEHLPFDLIAISEGDKLVRLSIKYRAAKDNRISLNLKSSWSDSHGLHTRPFVKHSFDAIAIYCPDTKKCYYIRNNEIDVTSAISLRLKKTQNNQIKRVRSASKFCNPERLFAPVAQ